MVLLTKGKQMPIIGNHIMDRTNMNIVFEWLNKHANYYRNLINELLHLS